MNYHHQKDRAGHARPWQADNHEGQARQKRLKNGNSYYAARDVSDRRTCHRDKGRATFSGDPGRELLDRSRQTLAGNEEKPRDDDRDGQRQDAAAKPGDDAGGQCQWALLRPS